MEAVETFMVQEPCSIGTNGSKKSKLLGNNPYDAKMIKNNEERSININNAMNNEQ